MKSAERGPHLEALEALAAIVYFLIGIYPFSIGPRISAEARLQKMF